MLVAVNHWLSSTMLNDTINEIRFNSDNNNNSQVSQYIEPMWASLSLIISKL